jgi:hypothetical protein
MQRERERERKQRERERKKEMRETVRAHKPGRQTQSEERTV